MADRSGIEWTDATWSPIRARNRCTGKVGWHCEHVTPGCERCYAERINQRLGTGLAFKPGHLKDVELFLDEKLLTQPLRWRAPRMIFVCSMTDLFADFVPDEWIDRMFAVMALTPRHTYQVLTKRSTRMRAYCSTIQKHGRWLEMEDIALRLGYRPRGEDDHGFDWISHKQFLPNVWLGVSAERQPEADARIPDLIETPAAVRFVSAEPMLGHIDLHALNLGTDTPSNALRGVRCQPDDSDDGFYNEPTAKLDWVIVGGESGPGARDNDFVTNARALLAQCRAAGVPFFGKQNVRKAPLPADLMIREFPTGETANGV